MAAAQITVRPLPGASPYPPLIVPPQDGAPTGTGADPWSDLVTDTPPSQAASNDNGPSSDPWADLTSDTPPAPSRQVGAGEALGKGFLNAATFGIGPAINGLSAAAGQEYEQNEADAEAGKTLPDPSAPIVGAAKILSQYLSGHPDPDTQAAYERGREAALADQNLVKEQKPWAYLAGQLGGALALPGLGAVKAGTAAERFAAGVIPGAVIGGGNDAGNAISEGKSLPAVIGAGATGAVVGGVTGGTLGAAIGPRVVNAASPGQRAAQTAEALGAPLPKGLASDSRILNNTTAAAASVPLVGARIGSAVGKTQEAAGEHVADIASQMTGGSGGRAAADMQVRPGLQDAIDANKADIDAGYNDVRSRIDQDARFTMPRTDATLTRVMQQRHAAGWQNPAQGLEQFRNVAAGATFNGAHRARVDAREAGNALVPHPGYNAGDYGQITRAMTADIRDIVRSATKGSPNTNARAWHARALALAKQQGIPIPATMGMHLPPTRQQSQAAVDAFDKAEKQFGILADRNGLLNKLLNAKGEGAIQSLMGSAKEVGGNIRLLAQLRQSMGPNEFAQIGGTLLNELGHNTATGKFSLAKFATNWDRLSDGAKRVLFSQQHAQDIEDIVNLGTHVKGALREGNTSHTSNVLILYDLAQGAVETGIAVGAGLMSGATVAGSIAAGAPIALFMHWLASPARAASMSAWTRAYRGVTLGQPTPARIAAFKIATRNMANTLEIPVERVTASIQRYLSSEAGPEDEKNQAPASGPKN